jgi:hypothetical protein
MIDQDAWAGRLVQVGGAVSDPWGAPHRKEDSSFSQEKEAKRLLSVCLRGPVRRLGLVTCTDSKGFFCCFFSKKKTLSYVMSAASYG